MRNPSRPKRLASRRHAYGPVLCFIVGLAAAVRPTHAFNPPTDSVGGITLRINGVPETAPASEALSFTVTVRHENGPLPHGTLRVWLNDDWRIDGKDTADIASSPDGQSQYSFTARPSQRVLAAHYPVHAEAMLDNAPRPLHAIGIFRTVPPATRRDAAVTSASPTNALRVTHIDGRACCLERLTDVCVGFERDGSPEYCAPGWTGSHHATGATYARTSETRGGTTLSSIGIHPAWRGCRGPVWGEYRLALPNRTPLTLEFSHAIRDSNRDEPRSDGVDFAVRLRADGEADFTELYRKFTDAKTWQPARVDLSAYAGKTVRLVLWTGPGPRNDTTCDGGFWGEPTLLVGNRPPPPTDAQWAARERQAIAAARTALNGRTPPPTGAWRLTSDRDSPLGAAFVVGSRGLIDGVLAFADAQRALTFRSLCMDIDDDPLGQRRAETDIDHVAASATNGALCVTHRLSRQGRTFAARALLTAERGSLTLCFSMPGVTRDARGTPRFTRLALGPANARLFRIYAGFGNVIESPQAFSLQQGGNRLMTRHVGADYTNGLSLLQATDIFPDRVVCDPARNLYSLECPHDATFRLIASTAGAFAAARHYRDLAGFTPGGGVPRLLGRMCIDQWGGDYRRAAADLERVAAYGVNHAIFVKHDWQRWGYDYRLPDIYPPAHGLDAFRTMPEACRKTGMLFAPHDNYIDFYPDADGFSYDHILFNTDGTPQRAWYNRGRQAQSYRWLPHAFMPWLRRNMTLMHDGFHPDGLFIDVFSSIGLMDYYDRDGNYYTRKRTAAEWSRAFDVARASLGDGAPMLSEGGHDGLIGSLDGGQADHYSADRWGVRAAAYDRTPWHDMASHGRFVLLAGGLGHRYANDDPEHSYGTDDYLSNTVIGGRNPMCDGPFSRRTVMTYWLLHDVCNALAHASLETHAFGDNDVHRQHTTFGDGSRVWTNRGDADWSIAGHTLPMYGFLAQCPEATACVALFDGHRAAYAKSPAAVFADARPPTREDNRRLLRTRVISGEYRGGGTFAVTIEWDALEPLEAGLRPFVHICHASVADAEHIRFQASMDLPDDALCQAGRRACTTLITIPRDAPAGDYTVRYGLYNPGKGGYRVIPYANLDGTRVRGGILRVAMRDGRVAEGTYISETPPGAPTDELDAHPTDFGDLVTDGAFRLETPTTGDLTLIPLPKSIPFTARLRLDRLGRPNATVRAVEAIAIDGTSLGNQPYTREANDLCLKLDAHAFAYRIRL